MAPDDNVSVEMGWAGEEITGLRLKDWAEDVGGILVLRGTSGQEREFGLQLLDGRLIVRVGEAGGDTAPVDPPVDPPPGGGDLPPVVPEGYLGLTRQVHGWVISLVDLAMDPNRGENAQKQAENYAKIAEGLAADPPKWDDVATAFGELRDLNRQAIPEGSVRDAWAAFALRVTNRIEGLFPFDTAKGAKILSAIADGLKAAG